MRRLTTLILVGLVLAFFPSGSTALASRPPTPPSLVTGLNDAQLSPVSLTDLLSTNLSPAALRYGLEGPDPGEVVEVMIEMSGKPLAQIYAQGKANGERWRARSQQNYVGKLQKMQVPVIAAVQAKGGTVIGALQKVYNGIHARVRRKGIPELMKLPGVVEVHRIFPKRLTLADSVDHIGATKVIRQLGFDGTNVNIGIIDTGIDYYHASLGGTGDPADYAQDNPEIVEPGTFPTAKVIGGIDLAGTLYDAGCSAADERAGICTATPQPDEDPLDKTGHGSHVASIAGGLGVPGRIHHGVAPGAYVWAIKVFGDVEGSTSLTPEALEWAADPNGDSDISDHLDVVNLSLGCPFGCGGTDNPGAVAVNNAVDMGIVVVASAGNAGNVPYITGSPGTAHQALSVASSFAAGEFSLALRVNSPENVAGDYEAKEAGFTPPLAQMGPVSDTVKYVGRGCQGDAYLEDPGGAIALIDRGACRFDEKIARAGDSGAVAVIVANNQAGPPSTMSGDPRRVAIPAVMISQSDGEVLKETEGTINVTMSAENTIPKPGLVDVLSDFTSRGPSVDSTSFKPEVTAPGSGISAAAAGTGTGQVILSGTSMSAPHVTGVVALLQQAYPAATQAEIKARIMNGTMPQTWEDGNPAFGGAGTPSPLSHQGAGLVQADKAIQQETIVQAETEHSSDTPALNFGFKALMSDYAETRTVTVRNTSDETKTYILDWTFRFPDEDANAGVSLSLDKTTITVPAAGTASFAVSLRVSPENLHEWQLSGGLEGNRADLLTLSEYDGYVTVTDADDETVRLPFYLLARRAADLSVPEEGLTFIDFGRRNVRSLTLSNATPFPGTAEAFSLLEQSPPVAGEKVNRIADIRNVGVRNYFSEEDGDVVEFAIQTHAPRTHPLQAEFDIWIDSDRDGEPDYVVFNFDAGLIDGGLDGRSLTYLWNLSSGAVVPQFFTETDFNSSNAILPVRAEDMNEDDLSFDFFVVAWDVFDVVPGGNPVDFAPADFVETATPLTYDGTNRKIRTDMLSYSPASERPVVNVWVERENVSRSPSEKGLLLLYRGNVPGTAEADAIPFTVLDLRTYFPVWFRSGR